jgi:hypothetical protein
MKLELRNLKLNKSLSDETPSYSAFLYVDGVKACELSNHGHGGPDMQRWLVKGMEAKVNAHFAALPKITTYGIELDQSLEIWAQTEVWISDDVKALKRRIAKSITGIIGNDEYTWKIDPKQIDAKYPDGETPREKITKGNPTVVFINGWTDEQVRAHVEAQYNKTEAA